MSVNFLFSPFNPSCIFAEESEPMMQKQDEMVVVPSCGFIMGSTDDREDGTNNNERPKHFVFLDSFMIDAREVTNGEFAEFVEATGYVTDAEKQGKGWIWDEGWREQQGANWRHPKGPSSDIENIMDHPVVQVSWNDAHAYCNWRQKRLPTEAEWECSCRAGTSTRYSVGDTIDHGDANYFGTGEIDRWEGTSPVGSFPPNPWGLYDMHGNVWEWCRDFYDEDYYKSTLQHNPMNQTKSPYRVMRGGAWDYCPTGMRSAKRGGDLPTSAGDARGFRCAVSVGPEAKGEPE
jgi:formylglycine-generating enzyme required for sulfatase activity